MLKRLLKRTVILVGMLAAAANASAEELKPSTCYAFAQDLGAGSQTPLLFASFAASSIKTSSSYDVSISFQGHSTYLIETGAGIKIATDYAGYLISNVVPDVVTMNQAHSSHYTRFPDPNIRYVLRGWGEDGGVAEHYLQVDDVLIRNVTTDILNFATIPNGNSIFIFETAGLCIGHLGHLHHRLNEEQLAKIGRLDVVMVPVDGGLTLSHNSVRQLLDRLRASVILPMHVRSSEALPRFLAHLGEIFSVKWLEDNNLILSLNTLPRNPTVMLLPGVSYFPTYED